MSILYTHTNQRPNWPDGLSAYIFSALHSTRSVCVVSLPSSQLPAHLPCVSLKYTPLPHLHFSPSPVPPIPGPPPTHSPCPFKSKTIRIRRRGAQWSAFSPQPWCAPGSFLLVAAELPFWHLYFLRWMRNCNSGNQTKIQQLYTVPDSTWIEKKKKKKVSYFSHSLVLCNFTFIMVFTHPGSAFVKN